MGDDSLKATVSYESLDKRGFFQRIKESIPPEAHPTHRTATILGAIFVLVIVIGIIRFPFFSFMGGSTKVSAKIGIPLTFLELNLTNPSANPINPLSLIVDLLVYVFLAYLIDILINYILNSKFMKTDEEIKALPREYKLKN